MFFLSPNVDIESFTMCENIYPYVPRVIKCEVKKGQAESESFPVLTIMMIIGKMLIIYKLPALLSMGQSS